MEEDEIQIEDVEFYDVEPAERSCGGTYCTGGYS